ncbi:MAG: hypothetical protein WC123_03725, partial [Bacilli bacterium]
VTKFDDFLDNVYESVKNDMSVVQASEGKAIKSKITDSTRKNQNQNEKIKIKAVKTKDPREKYRFEFKVNNMIDICIYHGIDLDGWCSAAIVKEQYPNCKMIPFNYGNSLPDLPPGNIVMVDISLTLDKLQKFLDEGRQIIWIDHHISAINIFKDAVNSNKFIFEEQSFKFSLNTKKAACELTWEYFNPNKKMPLGVYYLGRYDCFGHMGTPDQENILMFQYAARLKWNSVETTMEVLDLSVSEIDKMIDLGKLVYKQLLADAKIAYNNKYEITLDGYKFAIVNKDRFNPINFKINYHSDGYDGFISYYYSNGKWRFSVYNENRKFDCSEFCKKRGGGGHSGAAGFVVDSANIIDFL